MYQQVSLTDKSGLLGNNALMTGMCRLHILLDQVVSHGQHRAAAIACRASLSHRLLTEMRKRPTDQAILAQHDAYYVLSQLCHVTFGSHGVQHNLALFSIQLRGLLQQNIPMSMPAGHKTEARLNFIS